MILDNQRPKSVLDSYSNSNRNNKDVPLIFYCNDGYIISPLFICNRVDDCPDGSDEIYCSCLKTSSEIHYSVLNLSSHPFSNCVCKEPLEKTRHGGCMPYYLKTQHTIIKNITHNCSSEKIKCMYQIVGNGNREQIYCRIGYHLKDCDKVNCVKTYKCPGYYCLLWKYVCDGYWTVQEDMMNMDVH